MAYLWKTCISVSTNFMKCFKHPCVASFTLQQQQKSETAFKQLAVKLVGEKSNIGLIHLNDRKTMNTLSTTLVAELNEALWNFEKNERITCIILTGGERAFSVGADVREMLTMDHHDVLKSDFPSHLLEVSKCRKPVIAAVSGNVMGGGLELAMMCDIIYSSEKAVFVQPEISLATIPGAGGSQRLTRAIGKSSAMEMVLSGMKMSAKDACHAGLVSKVFPSDQVVDEAIQLAEKISSFSPQVLQMAKQAVNAAHHVSLANGIKFEKNLFCQTFALQVPRNG